MAVTSAVETEEPAKTDTFVPAIIAPKQLDEPENNGAIEATNVAEAEGQVKVC